MTSELNFDERPSTSSMTGNAKRGYNYFYNAK